MIKRSFSSAALTLFLFQAIALQGMAFVADRPATGNHLGAYYAPSKGNPGPPGTSEFNKQNILGSWRAIERGQFYTNTYYINIYPDDRILLFSLTVPIPCNGTWSIEGTMLIPNWTDYKLMGNMHTRSFDGRNWVFVNADNGAVITATKTATLPAPIPMGTYRPKPESNIIPVNQLWGTWTDQTFFYTFYPDQRFYHCQGFSGNWTLLGNILDLRLDNGGVYSIKTTSFSSTNWQYEGLSDGKKYEAKRLSEIPQKITSTCTFEERCCRCHKLMSQCKCPPPCRGCADPCCSFCNGTGKKDCWFCDGGQIMRNGRWQDCDISECVNGWQHCECKRF